MTDDIRVTVFRFDPSRDQVPRYQEYTVPRTEGMVIGDVLEYIYQNLDGSLAFRYECRTRQCGSCALEVNGKPGLACQTLVGQARELVLEPLSTLPLVRDLVTDRTYLLRYNAAVTKFTPDLKPRASVRGAQDTLPGSTVGQVSQPARPLPGDSR